MIKAAGHFHDKSILLQQEVTELRKTLDYKRIQVPGDQARLSQAKILDSQEIIAAIERRNAAKAAPKRQNKTKTAGRPRNRRSPSPVTTTEDDSMSGTSSELDYDYDSYDEAVWASEGSEQPLIHPWEVDDYSSDEIDLL